MNSRHHRPFLIKPEAGARPVRFLLEGLPLPTGAPAEQVQGSLPSAAELTRLVSEQITRLYPGLPRDALDGAAGQGGRQALAMALASPRAASALQALAIQVAQRIIALYLALAEQHHLAPVA